MNVSSEPRTQFFQTLENLLKKQGQTGLCAFAKDIFARVSWEDIAPHSPEAMLVVVQNAWAHVQALRKGEPSLRIYEPEWSEKPISILEIISTNRPFIFDSIRSELAERGLNIHLVAHPILTLKRNEKGACEGYLGLEPVEGAGIVRESFIHIHMDPFTEDAEKKELIDTLQLVLNDVKHAVQDWKAMQTRVSEIIAQFKANPPAIEKDEMSEAVSFLDWLYDNNFTFLGIREYVYVGGDKKGSLEPIETTGLGLLRDPNVGILRRGTKPVTMTPILRAFLKAKTPLIVSKGNLRSRVHRRAYMDYVGVKLFDKNGELTGELRITGLFTSTAYTRSAFTIPYIRRKVEHVLEHAGFDHDSHSGKALVSVLENFPRDELFQLDNETLYEFAMAVLELEERPRIRVLARRDEFERFVSVLVYVPRERVVTDIRVRIGDTIAKAFGGRISAFTPSYPEGPLARLHYIIGKNVDTMLSPERVELEAEIANIVQTWDERLAQSIQADSGGDIRVAKAINLTWGNAFDAAYQQDFDVETARADIKSLEKMRGERAIALDFYTEDKENAANAVGKLPGAIAKREAYKNNYALKIFHKNAPIPLSERVPMLEHMGFRVIAERTYTIRPIYEGKILAIAYLHNMELTLPKDIELGQDFNFENTENLFHAVWEGRTENDLFNGLTLRAGLEWRQIVVLRAISRYLRQVDATHTLFYMAQTLNKHAQIARHIFELFAAKFDPIHARDMETRQKSVDTIKAMLIRALSAVDSLDEDKILRRYINVIDASVRTNYYQNLESDIVSFKINSSLIEGIPKPVPMAEIWVYSPRVEGVHLRFGRIARGGLRWSDRTQDFRTEVLGLVKAQQVKNAVIVPVGAKGGFVPKQLPVGGSREAIFAEGTEAYKLFVGNLLAISDNRSAAGEIIPPAKVVRHDGDDPYLVVAADKGTATFSDTANGLSADYNFWLGDAFASGGSVGYDHKKMGITARGAWEAVKRHFRELKTDIQTTPFTVAGVGDMSGDVFGNGMLLSPAIKLVAAFDHRDIFLDPNPDIATSFAERDRMFKLPRSSWADYDSKLISKGGGIFSRSLKSIPISPEVQKALNIEAESLTPNELMTAILQAPVDLLWFGGIGTYVRANSEIDAQVGDRGNDAIRITATQVRAKAIGEGANLGVTQLSRIEMAQNGVKLNTDAIDNSAGVNSSDMEVNIKIALEGIVRSNRLSMKKRNVLLASMTEEVGHLVLMNNYRQTLAVSVAEYAGVEDLAFAERLMLRLEAEGRLDRKVEFLPSSAEIARRASAGKGLTRPEISVLLAYAKLALKADLLTSPHLDNEAFEPLLLAYFPKALQKAYKNDLLKHGLRREIIATKLVNLIIDQGGPTLVPRLLDQSGASVATLAMAFALAWQIFDGDARLQAIDTLDVNADGMAQIAQYDHLQHFMRTQTLWLIRNEQVEQHFGSLLKSYAKGLLSIHNGKTLPLSDLEYALEMIRIQHRTRAKMPDIITAWNAVGAGFMLPKLLEKAYSMHLENYFDTLAQARLINDIKRAQHSITRAVLIAGSYEQWQNTRESAVARVHATIEKEVQGEQMTLSSLAVLGGFIADLAAV